MKASKGQIVYRATAWNGLNTAVVRELRVHSWGKKVAKAYDVNRDGSETLIREQFYLENGESETMFATREEANAHALWVARNNVSKNLEAYRERKSYADYVADYDRRGLTVLDYHDAIDEIKAKHAARRAAA